MAITAGTPFKFKARYLNTPETMKFQILLLLFILSILGHSQMPLPEYVKADDKIYVDGIRTIQIYPSGNPMGVPFIQLGSGEQLEVHFDEMGLEASDYQFRVVHCSHDWQLTELESYEYIQGFPEGDINDVEASFNTIEEYVHYTFNFPNDMMKVRISGNYLLLVFESGEPEKVIFSSRIVIYETLVGVQTRITNSSNISERFTHQEFDFNLSTANFQIMDPFNNLHVALLQNWSWNNAITNLKPIFVKEYEITYDYSGENSFPGGSEWRYFEMKNFRFASIEVASIERNDEGWQVYLQPDLPRGSRTYETIQDLNGRYFVRNDEGSDSDLESEYCTVHFALQCSEIPGATVYLEGDFTKFDPEAYKCTWNSKDRKYECKVLMKQGLYNYRFVVRDTYKSTPDLGFSEGNHVETENDYVAIVYMWDRNGSYDRIIGQQYENSNGRKK